MDKQSQPFSFDAIKRSAENLGILAKKTVEKAVPYLDPTNPFYDKIPVLKQTRELSRSLGYDPAMDNSIPFKERLPMYLQKYGEGFMGSHGGLGKAPSKGILPNPIAKRAFQLADEMDAKGNVSIEQTDEVMQMVKDYLKIPEKEANKMTIPQMLQELTGNADNDQMAAFYRIPQRANTRTIEQIEEAVDAWKPGMRERFDQALFRKDKAALKRILPEVPETYRQRFDADIKKVLGTDAAQTPSLGQSILGVLNKNK